MAIERIKKDLWVQDGLFGWKIVYPVLYDKERGWKLDNINWKHLLIGSWANLIILIVTLLVIMGMVFSYQHDIKLCREFIENPCLFGYVIETETQQREINITNILKYFNNTGDDEKFLQAINP
jgi:hypothetical protein